jgi:hypothetical protein
MAVRIVNSAPVPNTCGVGYASVFREEAGLVFATDYPTVNSFRNPGGAGWLMAGFTDQRAEYKEVYVGFCKKYGQPVYQSPVRLNNRSGNKFFFAIWNTRKK